MVYRRSLVFPLPSEGFPPALRLLLNDYRLLVNQLLRFLLVHEKTARRSITPYARQLARAYRVNWYHASTAIRVAQSLAKGHRRRQRKRTSAKVPHVLRPFLRADHRTFHFAPETGKVRLSLRNGEWTGFTVPVPAHHRAQLAVPGTRVQQLVVTPDRISLVYAREAPGPYRPERLLSFDTNESSLDGVRVAPTGAQLCRVAFPEVRAVQARHFARRRRLARKKAHDRRVARRLLHREGARERHRVQQRLHLVSKRLVEFAATERAAIALEQLVFSPPRRRARCPHSSLRRSTSGGRALRRRLSVWPRRELHRQILYKAEARGVPVFLVNPRHTSTTCPRCGVRSDRRNRAGTMFGCAACGWRFDRQLNAGLNIARTVLEEVPELGGLWLDLDALPQDVRSPLYAAATASTHGRSGREGSGIHSESDLGHSLE